MTAPRDQMQQVGSWAAALSIGLWVHVGVAAFGVAAGGLLIIGDRQTRDEKFDGLGTVLGTAAGGVSLVIIAVTLLAIWLLRRGLNQNRRGLLIGAAVTSMLLAAAVTNVLFIVASFTGQPSLSLASLLWGLIFCVPPLGVIRRTRP